MVSWTNNTSGLSGYDAASGAPTDNKYLLASAGSVDVQGITRLQYLLPQPTYSDRVRAHVPLTYVAGDIPSGKKVTATMFVVPASQFAVGAVPTPSQIMAQGAVLRAWRSKVSQSSAGSADFAIDGPRAKDLQPNTKYWILVVPTAVSDMSYPANYVNDVIVGSVNTVGRALSMWANQTPRKPTITSPATNTVAASGVALTLSFTSDDPDAIVGASTYTYTDLAGVQVQYAAKPTNDTPSPAWNDLPIYRTNGSGPGPGSYLDGQAAVDNTLGSLALWTNRTITLRCGSSTPGNGEAAIPSGDWQIRMRTFDYGHPYPVSITPANKGVTALDVSTFPATNTSPWSDPVVVSITAQVPPPTPLSPANDNAVTLGSQITLAWLYRNTYQPPFAQSSRTVQLRKLGDPSWSTLVSGNGAAASYTVPAYTAGGTPYSFRDTGDATTGWTADSDDANVANNGTVAGPTVVSNQVRATLSGTTVAMYQRRVNLKRAIAGVPSTSAKTVTISGRRTMTEPGGDGAADPTVVPYVFLAGVSKPLTITAQSGTANNFTSHANDTWSVTFTVADGVGFDTLKVQMLAAYSAAASYLDVDDVVISAAGAPATGYDFQAGSQYEWRVQVTDAGAVTSNYSIAARFWIVPAPNTGIVRSLPTSTIDGATLGIGKHRVFVYRRGGTQRVGEIRQTSVIEWSRTRDEMSDAKVAVTGWDLDNGNLLAKLQCWAYELVIFRDNGYSVDRVWEGPITRITYEQDVVTLHAKDVMAYAYRRILKQKMSDAGSGDTVTSRAARVLQNALASDDPNVLKYMQVIPRADDARQYRSTPAYSRTAYEEVDDMAANAGLDYTVVGRAILLWGTKNRIGLLPEFRDADLGSPPIVSEYGMSMANRYVVSDGNGVYGEATRLEVSGNDSTYGLVEMLSSTWASDSGVDSGTYTQTGLATVQKSFAEYAENSIADRYPPPVVVRVPDNTSLNPGTVISIQQLVPGSIIPLRSSGTLRKIKANQKLDAVSVTEVNDAETITVTMSPFGGDSILTAEDT